MVLLLAPERSTPSSAKRLMTKPRTVLLSVRRKIPLSPPMVRLPSSSMMGVPGKSGCVVPSSTTVSVIGGSAVAGWMV